MGGSWLVGCAVGRARAPPRDGWSRPDQIGLLGALRPHERVLALLRLLCGEQRVELARSAIEAI
jgi:hypothetical protein